MSEHVSSYAAEKCSTHNITQAEKCESRLTYDSIHCFGELYFLQIKEKKTWIHYDSSYFPTQCPQALHALFWEQHKVLVRAWHWKLSTLVFDLMKILIFLFFFTYCTYLCVRLCLVHVNRSRWIRKLNMVGWKWLDTFTCVSPCHIC